MEYAIRYIVTKKHNHFIHIVLSTCVSPHFQLITEGFYWREVLLPACRWWDMKWVPGKKQKCKTTLKWLYDAKFDLFYYPYSDIYIAYLIIVWCDFFQFRYLYSLTFLARYCRACMKVPLNPSQPVAEQLGQDRNDRPYEVFAMNHYSVIRLSIGPAAYRRETVILSTLLKEA